MLQQRDRSEEPFPTPDLDALAAAQALDPGQPGLVASPAQPLQPTARRNDDPDNQRAGLETQLVAQTAALLEEAYGQQGSYQAQNYRVETIKPRTGPARYSLYDRHDQRILSFDREGTTISIRDDQLSSDHRADFLAAARTLDQQGLPETPQQASDVLGAMGPASHRAQYQERVTRSAQRKQATDAFATTVQPSPRQAHPQEQAKVPVTAHDLAEWRMASVTLGRSAAQVQGIEAHAQTTAQLSGAANFNQLYHQAKQAHLALQLDPQQRAALDRDLAQFRDLVQARGPGFVQNLYQLQSQAATPVSVTDNAQLRQAGPQPAGRGR
ncbi:MAG: hypothetical protein HC824_15085 [Synechococcales cyanobacterium RM1_1_8]|nr:hypothetical protein [Synechococcales cyanobacterium RM1_1_8]